MFMLCHLKFGVVGAQAQPSLLSLSQTAVVSSAWRDWLGCLRRAMTVSILNGFIADQLWAMIFAFKSFAVRRQPVNRQILLSE